MLVKEWCQVSPPPFPLNNNSTNTPPPQRLKQEEGGGGGLDPNKKKFIVYLHVLKASASNGKKTKSGSFLCGRAPCWIGQSKSQLVKSVPFSLSD